MEPNASTRERIFAAAEQLYEASGKSAFPTVDTVRKLARVNMNDACAGMKEWRRKQGPRVAVPAEEMPPQLQHEQTVALESLWRTSVALANEALIAAQSTWQLERVETEAMINEMANAYEALERGSDAIQQELQALRNSQLELTEKLKAAEQRSEQLIYEHIVTNAAAEQAQTSAEQEKRRADELRRERDQLFSALTKVNDEAAQSRSQSAQALAELHSKLETSHDQAAARAAEALELLAASTLPNANAVALK
jgi:chromosome segregation ATPase